MSYNVLDFFPGIYFTNLYILIQLSNIYYKQVSFFLYFGPIVKRSYVYVAINCGDGRRANKEESSLNANFLHYAGTGTSEVKNKSMISKHLSLNQI